MYKHLNVGRWCRQIADFGLRVLSSVVRTDAYEHTEQFGDAINEVGFFK
jgi:hypothetical protein